jgi:hypothetical protein
VIKNRLTGPKNSAARLVGVCRRAAQSGIFSTPLLLVDDACAAPSEFVRPGRWEPGMRGLLEVLFASLCPGCCLSSSYPPGARAPALPCGPGDPWVRPHPLPACSPIKNLEKRAIVVPVVTGWVVGRGVVQQRAKICAPPLICCAEADATVPGCIQACVGLQPSVVVPLSRADVRGWLLRSPDRRVWSASCSQCNGLKRGVHQQSSWYSWTIRFCLARLLC